MGGTRSPVSGELLQRVVEALPAGVVHVTASGEVLAANGEAISMLGLRFDAALGHYRVDPEVDILGAEGAPCPDVEHPVHRAISTRLPQPPTTIGLRRKSGDDTRVTWTVCRAVPLLDPPAGAVAIYLDVTEQRQAQAALRASEERWRSLAQNVPEFVLVMDANRRIVSLNRMARGYTEEQSLGTDALEYVHPDAAAEWTTAFEAVLRTGEPQRIDIRAAGDDGAMRWYETYMGPLRDGGQVRAVILVARDVTDHRALLRQLAEKERLASVGMLAASVAHEINNPLTYVLANLDFGLRSDRDRDARDRALAEARAGAERVRQIVRDLKVLAQPERDDLLFVDLGAVVEAAVRLAGPEVSHRAAVTIRLDDAPCVVGSDSRLIRLFINLLVNAAHAIEERGEGSRRIEITFRTEADGGVVAVMVRDEGIGIPADRLDRIFDPFYTTKTARGGTGLGLAICRDIAERAGGRIEVESEAGCGATFTVYLPTSAGSRSPSVPPVAPVRQDQLRVLIVDDDPLVLEALARLLADHDVRVAQGGAHGLAMLQEHEFDLVICDLMMPDLNGQEVYRRACARDPGLARRFLFVTGGLLDTATVKQLEAQGGRVLRKPFAAEQLTAAIAQLDLGRHRLR